MDHGTANSLNCSICCLDWRAYPQHALEYGELLKLSKRHLRLQARRLRLGAKLLFHENTLSRIVCVELFATDGDIVI